jgi:hypothetical protein
VWVAAEATNRGVVARKRGPRGPSAEQVELRDVRARLERAEAELRTARRVIEVQGKCAARRSVVFPV